MYCSGVSHTSNLLESLMLELPQLGQHLRELAEGAFQLSLLAKLPNLPMGSTFPLF